MMNKIENDCFAFIPADERSSSGEICKALSCGICNPDTCAFYKTKKQADESLKNAHNRLRSLPSFQQIHISENYYGGEFPWNPNIETIEV